MPFITYNGQLYEVTQTQYDNYTVGSPAPTGAVLTQAGNVAGGGTIINNNTATTPVLAENTTNNTPGQTLPVKYEGFTTDAPSPTTDVYQLVKDNIAANDVKTVSTTQTELTTQINNVNTVQEGGTVSAPAPVTELQTQIQNVATVEAGGTVDVPAPVTELQTQIQNVTDAQPLVSPVAVNGGTAGFGAAYDENGFLNPGYSLDEGNNPVFVGSSFVEPATQNSANASRDSARQQQARADQRRMANTGDWRVRLQLAQSATYLYKEPGLNQQGILYPLQVSDGVIFPYTPSITTNYRATYSQYDLTHSNYRGYFYQNSFVDAVQLNATFTAQDTQDANYLLAVIHFFRSVTKMFYGQDAQRGTPPPLVFLSGLGEFQFNGHACLVQNFNYTLPADVDYIRARSPNQVGLNLSSIRKRQEVASSLPIFGPYNRLAAAFLNKGGSKTTPSAPKDLGLKNPTYVPTKIDIALTLLPVQSRQQVSKQFSLKDFASGDLIRKGFW